MQSLLLQCTSFPLEVLMGFCLTCCFITTLRCTFPSPLNTDVPFGSSPFFMVKCSWPPLADVFGASHCVQFLLPFHALLSCCRKPRCPSLSSPGSGRALPSCLSPVRLGSHLPAYFITLYHPFAGPGQLHGVLSCQGWWLSLHRLTSGWMVSHFSLVSHFS